MMWLALAVILAILLIVRLSQPYWINWGSTRDEQQRSLPGDECHDHDWVKSTRGLTIRAEPACIWPWLCQMGTGRGGFYSYTLLEHILGRHTRNARSVHPEWQQVETGAQINLDQRGGLLVWDQIPDQYLLLVATPETRSGLPIASEPRTTWLFFLNPQTDGTTRLIVRSATACNMPTWLHPILAPIMGLASLIMERKMLRSIRDMAERQPCGAIFATMG
jgi:hypothetical protein